MATQRAPCRPGRAGRTCRRLLVIALLVAALLVTVAPAAGTDTAPPSAPARDGVWPLPGSPDVVRGFDPPAERWLPGHRGVDLAGHVGQPVRAALPGRVAWTGTVAGTGVVVVRHQGTRTTYQPVTADVAVGDRVAAGTVLGTLVLPGSHCGWRACLHWGWRRDGRYLDPLRLVGGGPVRLLPVTSPVVARPGGVLTSWPRRRERRGGAG